MYVNIISHDTTKSKSASNIMQYLEKENEKEKLKNEELILEGKEDEINPNSVEYFFNQDFNPYDLSDPNSRINMFEASQKLDENRGTQNLSSSNFYMLNISPSQKELEHMEKISIEELENRGLILEEIKHDSTAVDFFNEQKDQVMKLQMKLYTQEIMNKYAELMDREIYANQESLPSDTERKKMKPIIEDRYQQFLKDKGINLKESSEITFLPIENYSIKQEYDHGKIFNIYSPMLDKKIDLFVPEGRYKIEDNKLQIDEEYYAEKYSTISDNEKFKKERIEVSAESSISSDAFTDFVKEDKICINHKWDEFDKNLKLYFSSDEVQLKNGTCEIPQSVYNDKLYEVKSRFLSKEFAETKNAILDKIIKENGFDISKSINEKGEEIYINSDKVPSKDELKKLNIKASVEFNQFLVQNKHLPERKGFKISDWNKRVSIEAEVLAESDKAKLIKVNDERLSEPAQFWVANYAIADKESKEIVKDENGKISILDEFYQHKINEILIKESEEKISFVDYSQNESSKTKFIKNQDSIEFSFQDTGLKEPLKFNVQLEDVLLSEDGKYTMQRDLFEHKYEQNLIRQAEKQFKPEFEKIKDDVNKEMLKEKDFQKDKEIETRFKNLLVEKNILKEQVKNDNFHVPASIVEEKNNSALIAYKNENREEEIRLWVNKDIISKSDETGLYFKNENEVKKILDKAIARDDDKKQIVKIDFSKLETEDKKHKNESYKNYVFYSNVEGFSEPIKFSIKEDDLKKEGKDFYIEKHKLDYKLENAKKFAITKEFGNVKDDIKNEVWKEKGFDTSKRKLTGKDLLYYSKIETERKYNHKDKAVIKNKPILTQIRKYEKSKNPLDKLKIGDLQKQLLRDKITQEVIDEGVKKGGLNYHSHIVVSRHDKTSVNPKDKVSMSPNANQKDGNVNNGAKVGFNRDEFAKAIEKTFDEKFEYDRPEEEKYEKLNQNKKDLAEKISDRAKGFAKNKIKKEVLKHTGMNIVKDELNPTQKIKSELMPLPIPTSFPTSKLDAVIKIIKMAKSLVVDKGIHY